MYIACTLLHNGQMTGQNPHFNTYRCMYFFSVSDALHDGNIVLVMGQNREVASNCAILPARILQKLAWTIEEV
jgi:hypothetical protein